MALDGRVTVSLRRSTICLAAEEKEDDEKHLWDAYRRMIFDCRWRDILPFIMEASTVKMGFHATADNKAYVGFRSWYCIFYEQIQNMITNCTTQKQIETNLI